MCRITFQHEWSLVEIEDSPLNLFKEAAHG